MINNCDHEKVNDQIHFNNYIRSCGSLNIKSFSPKQFPNGLLFFPDFVSDKYLLNKTSELRSDIHNHKEDVLFVHANFMTGFEKKKSALQSQDMWYL